MCGMVSLTQAAGRCTVTILGHQHSPFSHYRREALDRLFQG